MSVSLDVSWSGGETDSFDQQSSKAVREKQQRPLGVRHPPPVQLMKEAPCLSDDLAAPQILEADGFGVVLVDEDSSRGQAFRQEIGQPANVAGGPGSVGVPRAVLEERVEPVDSNDTVIRVI